MKAGWQTKSLGDVCQLIGGGTPSKDNADYYTGDIAWATVRDMRSELIFETEFKITKEAVKNSATNIIPKGNVVIATRVGLGKVCLVQQDTAINQDLRGIVPIDKNILSVQFLFSWLKSISHKIVDEGTGATVQGVKLPFVKSLEISIAPLAEQERIVAILDQAFERIAKARANTEQNLQNARALFESHLQSVFSVRPELVEGRGEGWIEKTLGNCCILRSGTTLDPKLEMDSGEIAYLKVADMNLSENINGIFCSSRYVNENAVNISNLLPIGTTIFPKRGGSILTNKKRLTKRVIYADLNIMGVTPKAELLPEFLFSYFLSVDMRKLNNGSSIPQINNYTIEPLLISFPVSLIEQRIVVEKIESLSQEAQRLEALYQRKITLLDELKKSLLQQAFAGEL